MSFEDLIRQTIREEFAKLRQELSVSNQPDSYSEYPAYLKVKDAARFLDKSQTKVYEYLRKPGFPKINIDGTYLIPKDGLIRWMKEQEEQSA